tara:strand:- start:374 stop:568 length:195 start_codon:yes stop_codon:yes gene_type:complete
LKIIKNKTMTIFEHIESIKNQCELLLKELEEGKEPLDTWYHENMNQDLENLNNITFKNNDNGNK